MKRYFKDATIRWTASTFVGRGQYRFHREEHKGVLLIVDDTKDTVVYIEQYGVHYAEKKKRSNSLKWKGTEISKEVFEGIQREWKFEAATNRENAKPEASKDGNNNKT